MAECASLFVIQLEFWFYQNKTKIMQKIIIIVIFFCTAVVR